MTASRTARAGQEVVLTWRRLGVEQRVAGLAAVLLIVSTFGPFSFVEAAEILIGVGVLALLRARARGKQFHLPFGDGTVIVAAGGWAALLIVIRLFDRPLGQNLLALVCTAILTLAGLRERAKRPPDDLPEEVVGKPDESAAVPAGPVPEEPTRKLRDERPTPARARAKRPAPAEQLTLPDPGEDEAGGAD
jgi:hypothetical protein